MRAADYEVAGGVDQVFGFFGEHFFRQYREDDVLFNGGDQLFAADVGIVLGGKHHGVDAFDFAGFAVVHAGELGFGIGAQPRQQAAFAHFALALHQAVAVIDGKRHQYRGFVAGIAKHQALVAGAEVEVNAFAFVHALGDVGRLLAVVQNQFAGLIGKAPFGMGIADAGDGVARDLFVVHFGAGGDFTGQYAQIGGHQGFGGHARGGILRQNGIQHGIGNLVGHFIGMAFGDGFGSK